MERRDRRQAAWHRLPTEPPCNELRDRERRVSTTMAASPRHPEDLRRGKLFFSSSFVDFLIEYTFLNFREMSLLNKIEILLSWSSTKKRPSCPHRLTLYSPSTAGSCCSVTHFPSHVGSSQSAISKKCGEKKKSVLCQKIRTVVESCVEKCPFLSLVKKCAHFV